MTSVEDIQLFTPNELAEITGIGARKIRGAINRGELASVRLGGKWNRVSLKDFEAWLETKKVSHKSDKTGEAGT